MDAEIIATSDDNVVETPTTQELPKDRREAIEVLFDKVASEGDKPAAKAEPAIEAAKEQPAADVTEPPTDKPKAEDTKPATEPAPKPGEVKPPRMWAPEVREKFASLPEDVQQEVLKRERMMDDRLKQDAQSRQIADNFVQAVRPFESHLTELGVSPFTAVSELLKMGQTLKKGSAQQKALLIAQLVQNNDVDLSELDGALATAMQAPKVDPALQARLDRLERDAAQRQQQMTQNDSATINTTIEAFANDPKNEFFNDVAGHMVALLQSGVANDLQDAYEQACWANEGVRKAKMTRSQQDADRVKAANASLKGNTSPRAPANQKAQPKTRREALEAAWSEATGG